MGKAPKRAADEACPEVPTVIEFLLDETGSMDRCKWATIGGFNDFLSEQRRQNGLCLMTLTKFDTRGFRTPYVDMDVRMVPDLASNTFAPGHGTNLRDSLLTRIAAVEERIKGWKVRPNILFLAMTDGDDNASAGSEAMVRERVAVLSSAGWTFVYLGADQNALGVGHRLGFASGNCRSFAVHAMRETMQDLSAATRAYRAERAVATTAPAASTDFFATAAR